MKLERWAFLPDLALGFVYLVAWVVPAMVGSGTAGWLVLGVELEAVALLGAFLIAMGLVAALDPVAKLKNRLAGAALIVVPVAFAGIQVVRHAFWWPAIALAGLIANRVAGLVIRPLGGLRRGARPLPPEHARWCAFPGQFVSDFFEREPAGDWCAEPHRALAGGALYFLVSAYRDARRTRRGTKRGA